MRLSARNLPPGTVSGITAGQTTGQVRIDIGHGLTVTASITMEAIAELGLAVGDSVSAVIRASDVIVGK